MENSNEVYQTPKSNLTPADMPKLFSVKGITIATVIGSIFAGGLFMSMNYKRMGKPDEARKALVYSVIATIALLGLIMLIPEDLNIPNMVFLLPQIYGMYKIAEIYQKNDLEKHEAEGGEFVSNWAAFGYSLVIGIGIFAAVMLVALSLPV